MLEFVGVSTTICYPSLPWQVVGDFNGIIMHGHEKRDVQAGSNLSMHRDCQDFVLNSELMGLSLTSSPYTWSNNRLGQVRILERLDRALANGEWV